MTDKQGAGVDALWKALLPADVTEEAKKEWFHDLHWMINQGYIVLLSDGHIFTSSAAKAGEVKKKPAASSEAESKDAPEA